MTQDDLKLVLDALKFCHGGEPCGTAEAIAVVEKALAQPERTWVDLTQQELDELDEQSPSLHDFVQNLMSKLKEKNT